MFTSSFVVALALVPSFALAGLFKEGGPVKMLDEPGFRKAMKEEKTSLVAFVAPWCGHCKKLTPEYTRAADSLNPLIPFYSIDCDAEANKRLCAEQNVQGFPTIKSFPRGSKGAAHDYNGERSAGAISSWASGEVPLRVQSLKGVDAINTWLGKESSKPRAVLLTAQPKIPVLWKVLGTNFDKRISLGAAKDESGSILKELVGEEGGKGAKVIVWAAGEEKGKLYDGTMKFDPLSSYLDTLLVKTQPKKEEL